MLEGLLRTLWLLWNWLELIVVTAFMYLLAWLPGIKNWETYHQLSRIWCRFFIRALGIDLKLHQKNHQPLPRQYILVANHPSALEDFAIPALFNVHPLAKQGVRDWFLIGKISDAANTIFVKRTDPDSRHAAVDQMIEQISKGHNIAIFPEGGCKGRRIHSSFQAGAFDISMRTGIPVVPVFLHYEAQEIFEWHDPHTLPDKLWHFITTPNNRVNYYVYDAINPESFNDKKEYAEFVRKKFLHWQERYLD